MKKRLTAFFAAVFLLFSLSEAADASSSTYRNQLGRIENEIYDAMASYLPQGYDSFSYEFSQPAAYASAEEANSSLQTQVSRAYEAFYRDYLEKIRWYVQALAAQEAQEYEVAGKAADFLLLSLLYDDCTARGKGLFSGGIRYLGGTLECYGNITASDSLTALKKRVFDEGSVSLEDLRAALRRDFEGKEEIRQLLVDAPKFGNHDPEADAMAQRLHGDLCRMIAGEAEKNGLYTYLPVLINNDHNVRFGKTTGATPDGRQAGRPLTNGNSPSDGADKKGLTALLLSMACMDNRLTAGMVQNVKLGKNLFASKEMQEKTEGLIEAYFRAGGSQLMITVVSAKELRDAQLHPEKYQNLFVRVGGYSGRFISLPKAVQEDIIGRTLYE